MGIFSVSKKHCFFMYYFNFDWDHFSLLLVRGPFEIMVIRIEDLLI